MSFYFLAQRAYVLYERFPAFKAGVEVRRAEEGLSVLALVASQVTSTQNNQFAAMVHFRWPALDPYHINIVPLLIRLKGIRRAQLD